MIYSSRIRQAREFLGLTQTDVAQKLGVKQPAVAQMENGLIQPAADTLSSLTFNTGFPPAFFRKAPGVEFPLGSLLFRARASATQREKARAHRCAELLFEASENLASRLKIRPPHSLPRVDDDPEICAQLTRNALGLAPDTPIPNLVHQIEKAGVRVFMLPVDLPEQDAFSLWVHTEKAVRPLIALIAGKPGDRMRMSIAHEVAHLVMHREIEGRIADIHAEADRFAGEFLLPEEAIRKEIVPPVTLTGIMKFKRRWGASIAALIQRVYQLEIVTPRQFKYLRKQLAVQDWLKREPPDLDVPVEIPRTFRKMVELLYGIPIDYKRLTIDSVLPSRILREVLELGETAVGSSAPVSGELLNLRARA